MRTHVRVVRALPDAEFGVLERLLDEPSTWLPSPAHAIDARAYRVEVHAGSAGHIVDVVVGATRIVPDAFERSVAWVPEGRAAAVLPAFHGAIRLLDDIGSISLEIEGDYTPPAGLVGVAADRIALHRVAEHTLRRFADDVATNLVGDTVVSSRPDPDTS